MNESGTAIIAWVVVILIVLLFLHGCAPIEQRPPPEAKIQTVEVKIPIPTPCFRPEDVPPAPTPTPVDFATATTEQKVAAFEADAAADALYMTTVIEPLFLKCAQKGSL